MRLDFKKKFSAEKTIVLLSLVEISAWEKAAIKAVGAPNIVLKKTYPRTQTKVDINSALDLFINIRVDFANNYVTHLIDYAEIDSYINDIQHLILDAKNRLLKRYDEYLHGLKPDEDEGSPYCTQIDGHIHIFSGDELTQEVIDRMKDGEIFALIEDDEDLD